MNQSTALPSILEQQNYYTTRWNQFQYGTPLELTRMAIVLDFMSRIGLSPYPKVCDLGCGSGWSTNVLGMFGPATGVDLSDVSIAQERYPNCEFISINVPEWEAPTCEFDVVVSMEVIEHIEQAHQSKFLAIAHRMLKPGGHLVLTTPNKRTMNAIHGGGRSWSSQPLENWLSPKELNALLEENGFEVEARTSVTLGVASEGIYRIVNSPKLNTFLQAIGLHRFWQQAARWANFGVHLAILARKK